MAEKTTKPEAPHKSVNRSALWLNRLALAEQSIESPKLIVEGRLTRMVGLTMEAVGCHAPIGSRCLVEGPNGNDIIAEVVGFSGEKLYLMPTSHLHGIVPNARVVPLDEVSDVAVGPGLLGRVLDGAGNPLDGKGPLDTTERVPLTGRSINPLARQPIREKLDVGIRAINALLSVGRGQRMGLFAGSGVGKSVLLGMMTKYTTADVIVVGLIGERGREVKEFIENILGEEGMSRAVVVASPADDAPILRLHGAALATRIAEYFRDQGMNVLLLMDSLTRFAQAQREVALAIGEPPATKGYPPSVFAKIPQLVERAGNGDTGGGSITAFYTVLAEGDDQQDPIADAARAILDGHIVLSRELADSGHYPAIDVEASISRAMTEITTPEHQAATRQFKQWYSIYRQHRDLISVGAYKPGSDPRVDEAVILYPQLAQFLQQGIDQAVSLSDSIEELEALQTIELVTPQQTPGLQAPAAQPALPAGNTPYGG
ncbi:MAG: flagellar protein export ATPase FliI [Ectothiorhodospiraceae bacterium]|nr:flagellar protein export ATPase FliI [Ectothiorhodospiraceae bacterium]